MKIVFDTQGGCWEIQIGVAYKISQKCPDPGIYKTLGQMVRCQDGQKSKWSNVWMARCPIVQMSGWPEDQMSGWPDVQMPRWPEVQISQMSRSPDGQI